MIVGIDEVGRGSWAGPLLVVAARQFTELPKGLADSKVLSKSRRENLYYDIQLSCDIGEGWVEPGEIDALGLSQAMKLGVARALLALSAKSDEQIIMDGKINYCDESYVNVECIIDADALHPIVSAASIYAKVSRDTFMNMMHVKYPNYGFNTHVGYGTRLHSIAIIEHGISVIHRRSFAPIKQLLVV